MAYMFCVINLISFNKLKINYGVLSYHILHVYLYRSSRKVRCIYRVSLIEERRMRPLSIELHVASLRSVPLFFQIKLPRQVQ